MLRSYFQTLPADLEEAGMIDGCTRLEVIWRITLPLSLPGFGFSWAVHLHDRLERVFVRLYVSR